MLGINAVVTRGFLASIAFVVTAGYTSQPVVILPVPAERIIVVSRENRTLAIPYESRIIAIDHENRTLAVIE